VSAAKFLARPIPDVVWQNRWCRWKEGSVHAPNCKSFLVTGWKEACQATRAISTTSRRELSSSLFTARQGA